MNRFLTLAFVIAMIVASVLGVKWRQAVHENELAARRAERESSERPTVIRTNTVASAELRRLEAEVQSLRSQLAARQDEGDEVWLVQVNMLRRENQMLQGIISNQLQVLSRRPVEPMRSAEPVVEEIALVAEEEPPGIGMTVAGLDAYRLLNWRLGTMPSQGAAVTDVDPVGTASTAGILPGDIITSLNSVVIDNEQTLESLLNQATPGQVVTLEINRSGTDLVVQLLVPLEDTAGGE